MRRVAVDSASIAAIGYNAQRRQLEIEFRDSGEVYRYFEVPNEEYAAFMTSPSKGKYLNQVFKQKNHKYVAVRTPTNKSS